MTSPLGADVLIPTFLSAQEGISQPFFFDVHAISQSGAIDPDDLLNKSACVTLQSDGSPIRYFHGIVQSVSSHGKARGKTAGEFYAYRLLLVPRLWFLGQTVDCRVYQQKSSADILGDMFQDANLNDFSILPSGATREYTVQFNESDLAFATRLMEEEGWFYFFQHTEAAHKLIVANAASAFTDIQGGSMHLGGDSDATLATDWSRPAHTARGKMTLKDYDPKNPDTLLKSEKPTKLQTAGAPARDDFRWPANTFQSGMVSDRATWEMEAAEAQASMYEGRSQFGKLVPGGKITLSSRPATQYDSTYAIRSVTHTATDDTWMSQGASASYANHFVCFPASIPYRQPMLTPRPRMDGIHTALVLGPQHGADAPIKSQDGEEIHTDDMARVKVRFFWDHRAEATGGMSVWARVVQPWAGKGWGAQFIPRVGTEVAVAFVDGDPDRPIVIGGLYNGRDTPIYSARDKNKSGFRTRSTLKGGTSNFNEFTFDDTKGSELIFTHAEKDLTTEVENDQTLTIDHCRIVNVKKDETVTIGENRSVTVKQGNDSLELQKGSRSVTIDQGNDALDVKMGNVSIKAELGKVDIEAMQSITLTVGQNSIKIDQSGIAVNGLIVKISGQAMTEVKGPMTTVSGDGMLTLKGGIMMLN